MRSRKPYHPHHRRHPMPPSPGSGPAGPAGGPRPSSAPLGPRTDWDDVAEWYDHLVGQGGSDYHQEVVLPGILRLLGVGPHEHVLDVACGQGVLCRMLHGKGARVTGVDAAGQLIELAKERSDPGIEYHVMDARDLSALPAERFQAAACVLAIQNIQPLPPVFEGVARVLGPRGRFAMVMMHPCFRGPHATAWDWDAQRKIQYRRVDRYLLPRKEPIKTHPGSAPGVHTWTFHRPLQAYVKALRAAGLVVDALEEWPSHRESTSGPRAAAENQARKEIPLFLAMRALKL